MEANGKRFQQLSAANRESNPCVARDESSQHVYNYSSARLDYEVFCLAVEARRNAIMRDIYANSGKQVDER